MCEVGAIIKANFGNLTEKKACLILHKASFFYHTCIYWILNKQNKYFCRLYSLLHLGEDNDQSISVQEGAEGVTAAWLARRAHINRIPNGEFHAVNFRQIMAYILHDTSPM